MLKRIFGLLLMVFLLGWLSSNAYSHVDSALSSYDFRLDQDNADSFSKMLEVAAKEKASPKDRIKEHQIRVFSDGVAIQVKDPEWSTFTDTNSMDPVLDKGANAIHIVPDDADEIEVGDIVAYRSEYSTGTVIHRVIKTGKDEDGDYFILKGDNNPSADPGKVRFEQIERVLVAIIY